MKVIRYENLPFPAISIDNFIPNESLLRAASISFDNYPDNEWVKYQAKNGQVQYCSKVPRKSSIESLMVLDYIASNFNPSDYFPKSDIKVYPDVTHYGGGMMLTPNENGEGGFLGYHVDALIHGVNKNWKREYSAVLCLSEEYDKTFDLILHDGKNKFRVPYKFNRLNIFKCSEYSWHGVEKITEGMNRKTLGVMYWSLLSEKEMKELDLEQIKAKFMKV